MKMKKLLSILLALGMVAAVAVSPASADRGWHGRGGGGVRHEVHRGGGCVGCGFVGGPPPGGGGCVGCGFVGGLLLGGALGAAMAAPYYYAPPAPVYVAPPPPACYTQRGYWSQVPYTSYGGYTTYQNVWVPPQTVCP